MAKPVAGRGRHTPSVLTAHDAATATCWLHISTSSFHLRVQKILSSLLGQQGEQKLFPCLVLGFQ